MRQRIVTLSSPKFRHRGGSGLTTAPDRPSLRMIPFLCGETSMSGQTITVVQDLRDTQRYPCEVQTTCQPPSGWRKDPWPAVIRNVSTGGISLRLSRRFECGTGLAIDLPTEDGSTSTVLARVCHL